MPTVELPEILVETDPEPPPLPRPRPADQPPPEAVLAAGPSAGRREIATIVVEGKRYEDWDTVWVQHRWADGYPLFRFSCVERDPLPDMTDPDLWQTRVQWKPGERVKIYLGDILVLTGIILNRQVAYDANSHGVQLDGVGVQWLAHRSSVVDKETNFDGKTFLQITQELMKPFGLKVEPVGQPDSTPFATLQMKPGERIWDFLETHARHKGIIVGSNHMGAVLVIGKHSRAPDAELQEGVNILRMNCVVSIANKYREYFVMSSRAGDDKTHGSAANEMRAKAEGTLAFYSVNLTPSEHPAWTLAEVKQRAEYEKQWREGQDLSATVTVQGWFRPNSNFLWEAGLAVTVKSPMAILDHVLMVKQVTFTQDNNSGTLTTLELVPPWLLNNQFNLGTLPVGAPGAPPTTPAPAPAIPATPPEAGGEAGALPAT